MILNYGDVISLSGKLKKPRGFRNPGLFNYEFYLQKKGIYAICNLKDSETIKYIKNDGHKLITVLYKIKNHLASRLENDYPNTVS